MKKAFLRLFSVTFFAALSFLAVSCSALFTPNTISAAVSVDSAKLREVWTTENQDANLKLTVSATDCPSQTVYFQEAAEPVPPFVFENLTIGSTVTFTATVTDLRNNNAECFKGENTVIIQNGCKVELKLTECAEKSDDPTPSPQPSDETTVTFTIDGNTYTEYSMYIGSGSNTMVTSSVEESYWKSADESIVTIDKVATDASQTVTLTPVGVGSTTLVCTIYSDTDLFWYKETELVVTVTGANSIFVSTNDYSVPSDAVTPVKTVSTFEEALKYVADGGSIYLTEDMDLPKAASGQSDTGIEINRNVTVSSYGKAVTAGLYRYFNLKDNAVLTFKGNSSTETLTINTQAGSTCTAFVYFSGSDAVLNLNENFTVSGITFTNQMIYSLANKNSKLNYYGGTITGCTTNSGKDLIDTTNITVTESSN